MSPGRDYKAVTADLKQIYHSATEREAQQALAAFGERWDSQYPANGALLAGQLG